MMRKLKTKMRRKNFAGWQKQEGGKSPSRDVVYPAAGVPKELTMSLNLSAKLFEVIFFPGTWKGFETAFAYAAWNHLKN